MEMTLSGRVREGSLELMAFKLGIKGLMVIVQEEYFGRIHSTNNM